VKTNRNIVKQGRIISCPVGFRTIPSKPSQISTKRNEEVKSISSVYHDFDVIRAFA
jgi:hypothetical protein